MILAFLSVFHEFMTEQFSVADEADEDRSNLSALCQVYGLLVSEFFEVDEDGPAISRMLERDEDGSALIKDEFGNALYLFVYTIWMQKQHF